MKDLVRNPIGIIALFISLIYGFASLLLGATATSLTPDERRPIILFIVLFPCLVLGIFYLLVSRHHGKLYAPGDYKDDRSFLRTLSPEEREKKLETEAQEALPEAASENSEQGAAISGRPIPQRVADVRTELRVIESLVISKLESEFGERAERDVAVGDTGASFDAVFRTEGKLTFVEIKSIRHPGTSLILDRIMYNAVVAHSYFKAQFVLLLVVVYQFPREDLPRVEDLWRRRIEKCPAVIKLRFIHREDLLT
jgi:hypothetical protein